MIIPTLILASVAQSRADDSMVTFSLPNPTISGLPLRLSYRMGNSGRATVYFDAPSDPAKWISLQIQDTYGSRVAELAPERSLAPEFQNPDRIFQLGVEIEPGKDYRQEKPVRLDTPTLAPGEYTVSIRYALGGSPTHLGLKNPTRIFRGEFKTMLQVTRGSEAVEARARELIGLMAKSRPGLWQDRSAIHELSLIDHSVVLPLLDEVAPSRWSVEQLQGFVEEFGPYANRADAEALGRMLASRLDSGLRPLIARMNRADNPETSRVGARLLPNFGPE